jgi:hypothetical protein
MVMVDACERVRSIRLAAQFVSESRIVRSWGNASNMLSASSNYVLSLVQSIKSGFCQLTC